LHHEGLKTRAHIEPYPTPNIQEQNPEELLNEIKFVDEVFVGKWNYNKLPKEYPGAESFYSAIFKDAGTFCKQQKIKFTCG
jgi:hypothetical protein